MNTTLQAPNTQLVTNKHKVVSEIYYSDLLVRYMAGVIEMEGEDRIECTLGLSAEDRLVLESIRNEAYTTLRG